MKDKPFALIGVNVADYDAQTLKEIMDREELNWRSTADAGNTIAAAWNHPGTPLYYVLDPRGVIRYKWLGYPGEKALDGALENLIKAADHDEEKSTK